ncbi:MAG: TMEM165/GDT1 family protein [Tissierellia bacterium]|nr:TMEM165/GDT1 family protein [Tissierellia bacterium]
MLRTWLQAFTMVFLGELGDKSQLLALAFAATYPATLVLGGVSLGIALNHGIAILVAMVLSGLVGDLTMIQLFAGVLFLFFGFKSFWLEFGEEEEEARESKFGPLFTMAGTFFVGELGDKTQLIAMTLAMEHPPLLIFSATVPSMILVSIIGIAVGKLLGKRIPEATMSYLAGGLFLYFGITKVHPMLPEGLNGTAGLILMAGLSVVAVLLIREENKKRKEGYYSQEISQILQIAAANEGEKRGEALERLNSLTTDYLGRELPVFGSTIEYLENMRNMDQDMYQRLKKLLDQDRLQKQKP